MPCALCSGHTCQRAPWLQCQVCELRCLLQLLQRSVRHSVPFMSLLTGTGLARLQCGQASRRGAVGGTDLFTLGRELEAVLRFLLVPFGRLSKESAMVGLNVPWDGSSHFETRWFDTQLACSQGSRHGW